MSYIYNWNFDEYGNPTTTFITDKIHDRKLYKWTHPVHEILEYTGDKKEIITFGEGIQIDHHPDASKSRFQYLELLELSVEENPYDDRNMHYLGREYMYHGMFKKAIETLENHLLLPTSKWKDERCASMRFIGRCYISLDNYEKAKEWLNKAIIEAPYLREPYIERALLAYLEKDWDCVIYHCNDALKFNEYNKTYINEEFCLDYYIYDLLSISSYYKGNYEDALSYVDLAIQITPNNERLLENKRLFEYEKSSI